MSENQGRRADDSLAPQVLEKLQELMDSFQEVKDRQDVLERKVDHNTKMTGRIEVVLDLVDKGRGFFAVCDWIAGRVKTVSIALMMATAAIVGFYEYLRKKGWL